MTDTPTPEPTKKIDGPQAAIAISIIAALALFWTVLEPDRAEPATTALVTVLGLLGLIATARGSIAPEGVGAMLGALFGRRSSSPRPRPRPRPRPEDDRRSGHVVLEVMIAMVMAAACLIAGALVGGCGAGAIAVHARAATIATVALEGVAPMIEAETTRRVAECGPADVACVERVSAELAPWLADVDLAVIAVRGAVTSYITGVRLVLDVGTDDGGAVLAALGAGAGRLVGVWTQLAAVFLRRGIELPMPPLLDVATAVGGAL